ncbi:MAG TPA: prolyl oligopeptidase family serine peptidase [Dehalococcoidia bacterium]|nr:prolyl oligopeptidase family serine peptidase [Dehalococcoidia bacterium]
MTQLLPQPPDTRVAPVDEIFHDEHVPDPYRWLEDGGSAEVRAWTAAQNARTSAVLDAVPGREALQRRLAELLSVGWVGVPEPRGGRLFYERREGTQNQPVLYVREEPDGAERALVDPNVLSAAGTVALDWHFPSNDGRLLAYGLSSDGSEQSTLHVLDVDTGEPLPDTISRTRHISLAWLADGSGFYYTRLPAPGSVPDGEEGYHRRVLLHRLGDDPDGDALVWSERRDMRESPSVELSDDGRWLLLIVDLGWQQADVYLRDLHDPAGGWITVAEDIEALFSGEVHGETLYLTTNLDAPRSRLLAVPLTHARRERWREIVPERDDAILEGARIVGGRLALHYMVNAQSRLELRSLDGAEAEDVPLPGAGSVTGLGGERGGDALYIGYTSFTVPAAVYRRALAGGAVSEWAGVPGGIDPAAVAVRQVWYGSTDGARVSMFIVAPTGVALDGDRPVLLSGYGGFNISLTPAYSAATAFWLEQGGIFAQPNLRGGGEYGEAWHRAGMREQKQHTFDDFIAAAEWLIAAGSTRPERLAIRGGSNGGLLVGAAITQRPDLFRAAVCAVPLLDMLRFHRFLIAQLWTTEYGSAEDPEQYRWLRAYSPYHRVQAGTRYPAVLFTTAESDSRVAPLHARKMAALLQRVSGATPAKGPILLRVETQAGHGQGKPLAKTIEEQADIWRFICDQLGVPLRGE